MTCKGTRADNEPCQATPKPNGYCHHHQDQAPDRCQGTTTEGEQCKLPATQGDYCRHHVEDKPAGEHGNSLLTEDRVNTILSMADKAPFYEIAADAAGISRRTLTKWMARGRQDIDDGNDDTLAAKLVHGWQERKSRLGGNLLGRITQLGLAGDRKAAQYAASRMYPNELTDQVEVKHKGNAGGAGALVIAMHPSLAPTPPSRENDDEDDAGGD